MKSPCIFVVVGNHIPSQNIVHSSQKIRDIFVQLQITINLEAGPWSSMDEIVGTFWAPSEHNASEDDLTINLNLTLKKVEAALMESVIFGANCAPSEFEIRMNLTTSWKELLLKEVGSMKVLCPCAIIWNTLHKSFLLGTDTSINWKIGYILMLCSNVNATTSCQIDATIVGTWSCKELPIAWSSFGTGCCFAGLSFVVPFKNSFVTDVTTNLNMAEDLSSKDKALLFKTDATTNWNVGVDLSHLLWIVEVMGSHTNDAKVCMKLLSWKQRVHMPTMQKCCMKLSLLT